MRLRRIRATFSLLALTLALAASARAQQPAEPPLRVGEKLTYSVSFSGFQSAAHAEFYVAGRGRYFERDAVELRAHVQTVGAVQAALLSVNNYYFAYVDPQTGAPFRAAAFPASFAPPTTQDVLPTAPSVLDVTTIRLPAGAGAELSSPDFVSALYRARTLALAPGGAYPLDATIEGVRYEGELRVTGRETVNTPAGSFNAIATLLRVANNREANDYRLRVYFSDDARRVPVMFVARHPSGEIRALLASDETVPPPDQPAPPAGTQPTPRPTAAPNVAARPNPPTTAPAPEGAPGDLPFKVGEQLNFNFFLNDAPRPVGSASFQVRSRGRFFNRDGLLLTASMQTTEPTSRLFLVRDQISSYVGATTLLPFRTELQIQEGTHRVRGTVIYDQERSTATGPDGARLEIPVGTYDLVSILYALRSFDLTPPKQNAVAILINKRPRTLFINSLSRDTLELGGQRIPAFQLALRTDDPQSERLQLRLWIGADKRRLPLRVTANTPLGQVRGDLAIIPLTRQ